MITVSYLSLLRKGARILSIPLIVSEGGYLLVFNYDIRVPGCFRELLNALKFYPFR